MPRRGWKVVVLAHCLLNQNSVVYGLAKRKGMFIELLDFLDKRGFGVVQLPCPETTYAGLSRFWQSVEQYDNQGFREHCNKLTHCILSYLNALREGGVKIVAIIGVKGSPSCGIWETFSANWRGNPLESEKGSKVRGRGVFMRILLEELSRMNFNPILVDFDTSNPEMSLRELQEAIK